MAGTEQLRFTCDPCFTHGTPLREDRAFLHKLLAFFHSSGRDCAGTGHCIKAHVVVVDDADVDGDEDLLHTLATDLWDLAPDEARTRFIETEGYSVLRFWNNDVMVNIDGVIAAIAVHLPDMCKGATQ